MAGRPAAVSSAMVEAPGQVGQIGGELGRDAELRIFRPHLLDILGATLLRHLQPAAEMLRQQAEAARHHIGQDARALAAARHQHAEDAVLAQGREGLRAERDHFVPHRIADQMDLVLQARRQPVDPLIGGRDGVDAARHQPIDAAEHGVLLVDDGRYAHRSRREQGRQSGVAAEADHRRRPHRFVQSLGHGAAGQDRLGRAEQADRVPGNAAGGQDMDGHAVEQAGNARAALVRHQCDMVAALHQLLGQGMGRDHMPAGAAGGEDIMTGQAAAAHVCAFHRTT
jgi:hypothetical protein